MRALRVDAATLERVRDELPELPRAKRRRFVAQYGLRPADAIVLTASRDVADYFEAVAAGTGKPVEASNWVRGPVIRALNERAIAVGSLGVRASDLAELIRCYSEGRVNSSTARAVFEEMVESGRGPSRIISERKLEQIADGDAIEAAGRGVLDAHPAEVSRYLAGRHRLLEFFVGQLMRSTGGRADPEAARRALERLLDERR